VCTANTPEMYAMPAAGVWMRLTSSGRSLLALFCPSWVDDWPPGRCAGGLCRRKLSVGDMDGQLRAQLQSSSGRRSKAIRDAEHIEAIVEIPGAGRLVLRVDRGGGYSLRGWPEGEDAPGQNLLVVGVVRPDGIVAVRPEGTSADERH
jgi:hypothetical protein